VNFQHPFQLKAFFKTLFLIFSAGFYTSLKAQAPVVPVSISGSVFF
jgi:hypothetical protein